MQLKLLAAAVSVAILAGCSSVQTVAPVEDRSFPQQAEAPVEQQKQTEAEIRQDPGSPYAPERAVTNSGATHTVSAGDTIYNIGVRYHVPPRELMKLNGIKDPTKLSLGQVLQLPESLEKTQQTQEPAGAVVDGQPVEVASEVRAQEVKPVEIKPAEVAPTIEVAKRPETAEQIAERQIREEKAKRVAASRGELTLPWPVKGEVISRFENNKMGIDIAGELDTPVQCVLDGTVQYVGNNTSGYGRFVIVRHNIRLSGKGATPLITVYGNTSQILVKVGESVRAGQTIALMGKSDSKVVKLRFEVRQGKPLNPMLYLEK